MATSDEWLAKLARLKVDKARGDLAPHKPLLLLVVLDLAASDRLPPVLPLSPELAFRFATYWRIVAHRRRQRPNIRLPFHHLGGDGVWVPLDERSNPSAGRELTRQAALSADLRTVVSDSSARERMRRLLIARYFPPAERAALYELVGLPIPDEDQTARDAVAEDPGGALHRGREARFRLIVVAGYNYTCALTGHRLMTVDSDSLVDAAHIHRFADSRNNEPGNGIALSKNAHWLFDQGLWSLSPEYRVLVAASKFTESCPDGTPLSSYRNRPIRLPPDPQLRPHPDHLAWHREHVFLGE